MIFAEEMNSYYGGPTFQPNSAVAGAPTGGGWSGEGSETAGRYQTRIFGPGGVGPPPTMEPWKGGGGGGPMGPAGTSAEFGGGFGGGGLDGGGSKLMTKWGGHPMDYGKQQQQLQNQQVASGPIRATYIGGI